MPDDLLLLGGGGGGRRFWPVTRALRKVVATGFGAAAACGAMVLSFGDLAAPAVAPVVLGSWAWLRGLAGPSRDLLVKIHPQHASGPSLWGVYSGAWI